MRKIVEKNQLEALAAALKVRSDWHEPDEQEVTVVVEGCSFDNAGFWPSSNYPEFEHVELHVVISQQGIPVAAVNLADLFAWARRPSPA